MKVVGQCTVVHGLFYFCISSLDVLRFMCPLPSSTVKSAQDSPLFRRGIRKWWHARLDGRGDVEDCCPYLMSQHCGLDVHDQNRLITRHTEATKTTTTNRNWPTAGYRTRQRAEEMQELAAKFQTANFKGVLFSPGQKSNH